MVVQGCYCLCIRVKEVAEIAVGALGTIEFMPSSYVYVGSALNGLFARVRRHINMSYGNYRAIFWHIDYLLKDPRVEINEVYIKETNIKSECEISKNLSAYGEAIKGFGSSDCNCISHLYKINEIDILSNIGLEKKYKEQFFK